VFPVRLELNLYMLFKESIISVIPRANSVKVSRGFSLVLEKITNQYLDNILHFMFYMHPPFLC
jgi:hypothetical protein